MNQGGKFFVHIRIFLLASLVAGTGWFGVSKFTHKTEMPVEAADNTDVAFNQKLEANDNLTELLAQGSQLTAINPHQAMLTFARAREIAPENRDANLGFAWATLADTKNLSETKLAQVREALAVARTLDPLDPTIGELQTALSQTRVGA